MADFAKLSDFIDWPMLQSDAGSAPTFDFSSLESVPLPTSVPSVPVTADEHVMSPEETTMASTPLGSSKARSDDLLSAWTAQQLRSPLPMDTLVVADPEPGFLSASGAALLSTPSSSQQLLTGSSPDASGLNSSSGGAATGGSGTVGPTTSNLWADSSNGGQGDINLDMSMSVSSADSVGPGNNGSSASSADASDTAPMDRQRKHRFTEKRRRERINEAVRQIQAVCGKKGNKAQLLTHAAQQLQSDMQLVQRLERARKENTELKLQLQQRSVLAQSAPNQGLLTAQSSSSSTTAQSAPSLNYEDLFWHNAMAMCITDMSLTLVAMNKQFKLLVGAPDGVDPSQLSCMSLSDQAEYSKVYHIMQRLSCGQVSTDCVDKKLRSLDGRQLDVRVTMMIAREANVPKYVLAVISPKIVPVSAHEQLRRAQASAISVQQLPEEMKM